MSDVTRSQFAIHVVEFGSTTMLPLSYPAEITEQDLVTVARTMLESGKVREAKVIDRHTGTSLWHGVWTLDITNSTHSGH